MKKLYPEMVKQLIPERAFLLKYVSIIYVVPLI